MFYKHENNNERWYLIMLKSTFAPSSRQRFARACFFFFVPCIVWFAFCHDIVTSDTQSCWGKCPLNYAQGKWCLFYTRKKCEINCFGGHKHGFFSYTCAASNRVASQLVWIELRWTKSCASSRKSLPWSYCLFRLMSHNSFFSLFSSSFHLIAPNNVKSINNLSRIRRFKAA